LEAALSFYYAGISKPMSIAMIAITTSVSISVNPRWSGVLIVRAGSFFMSFSLVSVVAYRLNLSRALPGDCLNQEFWVCTSISCVISEVD